MKSTRMAGSHRNDDYLLKTTPSKTLQIHCIISVEYSCVLMMPFSKKFESEYAKYNSSPFLKQDTGIYVGH